MIVVFVIVFADIFFAFYFQLIRQEEHLHLVKDTKRHTHFAVDVVKLPITSKNLDALLAVSLMLKPEDVIKQNSSTSIYLIKQNHSHF